MDLNREPTMEFRAAIPADHTAIHDVNSRAFGHADEADLVDRLRQDGDALVELVAVDGPRLVGHILFSRLGIEPEAARPLAAPVAALAPVAVVPDRQRHGIGSALIRHGLEACAQAGIGAVIVLGHPEFYPRFGFSSDLAGRLRAPFSGPAFMALQLAPDGIRDGDQVRYPTAFGDLA